MKLSDYIHGLGPTVAYYPWLATAVGHIKAALLLCQFLFWSKEQEGAERAERLKDVKTKWFAKSTTQITLATGLSVREQETARKQLRAANLIQEKYARQDHQLEFAVNTDVLHELWENRDQTNPQRRGWASRESSDAPPEASHNTAYGHPTKPRFAIGSELDKDKERQEAALSAPPPVRGQIDISGSAPTEPEPPGGVPPPASGEACRGEPPELLPKPPRSARVNGENALLRKAKPQPSPKLAITDAWGANYEAHFHRRYVFCGAKDGQAADRLAASGLPLATIIAVAQEAWKHPDDFDCKQASSLARFASCVNDICSAVERIKAGVNARATGKPLRPSQTFNERTGNYRDCSGQRDEAIHAPLLNFKTMKLEEQVFPAPPESAKG